MAQDTRPYMSYEQIKTDTKFGPIYVVFNGPETARVITGYGHDNPHRTLTIRGVEYSVAVDVCRLSDGSGWDVIGATPYERHQSTYVSRVSRGASMQEVSQAARKTITEVAVKAINDAVQADSDAPRRALLISLNNDIGRKSKEAAELREKLIALEVELDTMTALEIEAKAKAPAAVA